MHNLSRFHKISETVLLLFLSFKVASLFFLLLLESGGVASGDTRGTCAQILREKKIFSLAARCLLLAARCKF